MAEEMYRKPRYNRVRIPLTGAQPLELVLGFPARFLAFTDVSEIDPTKVYVAINDPSVFIPLSHAIIVEAIREENIKRLLFTWDSSQEGKSIEIYYAGKEGFKLGSSYVIIDSDFAGLAKESTLQSILSQLDAKLSTRASEETLSAIKNALASVGTDKMLTTPDNPPNLDVALSTRASESTLSSINNKIVKVDTDNVTVISIPNPPNLDITMSSLRDALKPSRSTVTQVVSGQSIGAGGTYEFIINDVAGWSAVVVTVKVTYGASPTNGVRVRWLYSPDGTNFDTSEDADDMGNYSDITYGANATRQRTIIVPLITNSVKIQIANLDSSNDVTVDVWYNFMR